MTGWVSPEYTKDRFAEHSNGIEKMKRVVVCASHKAHNRQKAKCPPTLN